MCCGRNSGPFRTSSSGYPPLRTAQAPAPTASPPSAWMTFEYVGRTRLVVTGPRPDASTALPVRASACRSTRATAPPWPPFPC